MKTIELTDEQAEELKDVLQREIDHLTHLVGDSTHADDISDQHRKSVLSDILELLEIA
jgi:DNA-binding PadR family transcriptional regulator